MSAETKDTGRFAQLQKFHRTPKGLVNDAQAELGLTDRSLWLLLHLSVRVKRFDFPDNCKPGSRVIESDVRPLLAAGWVEKRPNSRELSSDAITHRLEITDAGLVLVGSLVRWLRASGEGGAA